MAAALLASLLLIPALLLPDDGAPPAAHHGEIEVGSDEAWLDMEADVDSVWRLALEALAVDGVSLPQDVLADTWLVVDDLWLRLEPLSYRTGVWTRARVRVGGFESDAEVERARAVLEELVAGLVSLREREAAEQAAERKSQEPSPAGGADDALLDGYALGYGDGYGAGLEYGYGRAAADGAASGADDQGYDGRYDQGYDPYGYGGYGYDSFGYGSYGYPSPWTIGLWSPFGGSWWLSWASWQYGPRGGFAVAWIDDPWCDFCWPYYGIWDWGASFGDHHHHHHHDGDHDGDDGGGGGSGGDDGGDDGGGTGDNGGLNPRLVNWDAGKLGSRDGGRGGRTTGGGTTTVGSGGLQTAPPASTGSRSIALPNLGPGSVVVLGRGTRGGTAGTGSTTLGGQGGGGTRTLPGSDASQMGGGAYTGAGHHTRGDSDTGGGYSGGGYSGGGSTSGSGRWVFSRHSGSVVRPAPRVSVATGITRGSLSSQKLKLGLRGSTSRARTGSSSSRHSSGRHVTPPAHTAPPRVVLPLRGSGRLPGLGSPMGGLGGARRSPASGSIGSVGRSSHASGSAHGKLGSFGHGKSGRAGKASKPRSVRSSGRHP